MKPDELRALADALEPMARAPRFEDFDVPGFCEWVRACADAKPLAWRCEVRGDGSDPKLGAVDWRHYHTTTSEREAQAFVARCGDGIEGRAVPLYAHPAPAASQGDASRMSDALQSIRARVEHDPSALAAAIVATCDSVLDAAPQAEPIDPHMIVTDDRFPDEQAEPKREPMSELPPLPEPGAYAYEWRLQTGAVYRSFSANHYNGVPCDDQVLFFTADQMREYARAAYERAASLCDNADKSAHPADLADAIRALGRQHD